MEKLKASIKRRHMTVPDVFKTCDTDRNGVLTRRELQRGLESMGIILDYSEASENSHAVLNRNCSNTAGCGCVLCHGFESLEYRQF